MKRRKILAMVIALVAILTVSASPVLAGGKTPEVIANSNGFPSGMHFNLNIHGQDLSVETCTHEAGGNSVFIHQYGDSVIEYQADKRAGTELVVLDPCVCNNGGDDKVTIQLPKAVMVTEEGETEATRKSVDGYYVYARILGKPQNGKNDPEEERSNILFSQYNPTYTADIAEDEITELGLITWDATYTATPEGFYRFEDPNSKGRGKSKARSITDLFRYTGWVVHYTLDTQEPFNQITIADIPVRDWDNDELTPDDQNADGINGVDDNDIVAWFEWLDDETLAREYETEWIFNIADIVYAEGNVTNDGAKLLQIRFYPYFEEQ